MEPLKVTLKVAKPPVQYSEVFKKMVVREFERGALNKDQLAAKYGIKGNSRILEWCRKYGKFDYQSPTTNGRPMKDPQQQRIRELEKKLKLAEQKLIIFDKLLEVTNRGLPQDVVKKIEAELHESLQQIEASPSAPSAGSLAIQGKPTTNPKKQRPKKK
jgi:transposase